MTVSCVREWGRWAVGVLAWLTVTTAVTTGATAIGGVSPAGAAPVQEEPGITVTPADGLVDGQTVEVEVRGLGGATVSQCDAELVRRDDDGDVTFVEYAHCRNWTVPAGDTATVAIPVEQEYLTSYRGEQHRTYCGGAAADCLITAVEGNAPEDIRVATPIHFGPPRAEPGVTVTPDEGVAPGDTVRVEVEGMQDHTYVWVAQCKASVLEGPQDGQIPAGCVQMAYPPPPGAPVDPLVVTDTITEAWGFDTPDARGWACGPARGDCVIAAFGYPGGTVVSAPITVEPNPLAVFPTDQEAGFPVRAFVAGEPDATVTVAQCATPLGATAAASSCAPATEARLDGDGAAELTVDLVEEIAGPAGPVRCPEAGCALALFAADGTVLHSVPLQVGASDGPPEITLEGDGPLYLGDWVVGSVTGARNEVLTLATCDAAVVEARRLDPDLCGEPTSTGWTGSGGAGVGFRVERQLRRGDGTTVDCSAAPGACVHALETADGDFAAVPLTVAPAPTLTVTPATNLVHGQPFTVAAAGLKPGETYEVVRCAPGEGGEQLCENSGGLGLPAVAAGDGTATFALTARHPYRSRDHQQLYCRDQCQLALAQPFREVDTGTLTAVTMSDGTLTVSPAENLSDGQPVTVTGTGLEPTYGGGSLWFIELGQWSLVQCTAAQAEEPTLIGLFRACGAPPGGGRVQVPGPDLTATVEAGAGLQPFVGDPIDCASRAGACVVALARVEHDHTVTLVSAPLAFAPRPGRAEPGTA